MIERPGSIPQPIWDRINDARRRETLSGLGAIESENDPDFDRLTRLVGSAFDAPISLVTLVDDRRQWVKSLFGAYPREVSVENSICAHTVSLEAEPYLLVPDLTADARFAGNPQITEAQGLRFYAGAPIKVRGQALGALCVLDRSPRETVNEGVLTQLVDLAGLASALFELKDEARVRAKTAAELIKEEWRHALTLEAGKVGSWVWDVRTGDVVVNDILRRMFGLSPGVPVHVDQIFGNIHPDDVHDVRAAVEGSFEQGTDYVSEYRVGSGRWLVGRGRVYQRDPNGKPLVMMGVNIDITEAREAADHTRVLLRELNHRVKNTLAMIQSLARQTLHRNPDPQHFIDSFSGRLKTLSDAHALLSDRDWSGIGLLELIEAQVSPYLVPTLSQLRVSGEDAQLPPDHALGLGLVLHELSSNAEKYGALSVPGGIVELTWTIAGRPQQRVDMRWKEIGGPPVRTPAESGFGSRLIERSLDKVLDSSVKLSFPEDGVEARISLPLP